MKLRLNGKLREYVLVHLPNSNASDRIAISHNMLLAKIVNIRDKRGALVWLLVR